MDNENNNSLKQQMMIVSAQYPLAVLEIIKSVIEQRSLVGSSQYETLVNAITFDVQSEMLLNVSNLMGKIREGSLINNQ